MEENLFFNIPERQCALDDTPDSKEEKTTSVNHSSHSCSTDSNFRIQADIHNAEEENYPNTSVESLQDTAEDYTDTEIEDLPDLESETEVKKNLLNTTDNLPDSKKEEEIQELSGFDSVLTTVSSCVNNTSPTVKRRGETKNKHQKIERTPTRRSSRVLLKRDENKVEGANQEDDSEENQYFKKPRREKRKKNTNFRNNMKFPIYKNDQFIDLETEENTIIEEPEEIKETLFQKTLQLYKDIRVKQAIDRYCLFFPDSIQPPDTIQCGEYLGLERVEPFAVGLDFWRQLPGLPTYYYLFLYPQKEINSIEDNLTSPNNCNF